MSSRVGVKDYKGRLDMRRCAGVMQFFIRRTKVVAATISCKVL